MRWDLENMLRQVLDLLKEVKRYEELDCDPYIAGVEQVMAHIRQVRDGTATLDEFADLYMLRPKAPKA